MTEKFYISAQDQLVDSFRLAAKIYDSGFRPHFIIGVWRGGAPIGIAVQEFFEYRGIDTDHIAIRTSSYYGIGKSHKDVKVHGLHYVIDNVSRDQELLIVDDVFDSGRSIKATVDEIRARAGENAPNTIKVACNWYKPARNVTDMQPDYYIHSTDQWLVFPHELKDLEKEEILQGKGRDVYEVLCEAESVQKEKP